MSKSRYRGLARDSQVGSCLRLTCEARVTCEASVARELARRARKHLLRSLTHRSPSHRFASSRASQAALEFLSTYVWAFFVISVTIGALYYFGIFDFGKYLPQKCIFPSQFKCLDFSLNPAEVRIKLANNLGEDIKITALQITNDATPPIACTAPSSFDWPHSTDKDISFTSCSGGGYIPDERVELKISISYYALNTPSKPVHLISGKINGEITSS